MFTHKLTGKWTNFNNKPKRKFRGKYCTYNRIDTTHLWKLCSSRKSITQSIRRNHLFKKENKKGNTPNQPPQIEPGTDENQHNFKLPVHTHQSKKTSTQQETLSEDIYMIPTMNHFSVLFTEPDQPTRPTIQDPPTGKIPQYTKKSKPKSKPSPSDAKENSQNDKMDHQKLQDPSSHQGKSLSKCNDSPETRQPSTNLQSFLNTNGN